MSDSDLIWQEFDSKLCPICCERKKRFIGKPIDPNDNSKGCKWIECEDCRLKSINQKCAQISGLIFAHSEPEFDNKEPNLLDAIHKHRRTRK
jgi:hypothetical protein